MLQYRVKPRFVSDNLGRHRGIRGKLLCYNTAGPLDSVTCLVVGSQMLVTHIVKLLPDFCRLVPTICCVVIAINCYHNCGYR